MSELPINTIICGDCREVMAGWPDKCVDLVLTDPPYGISRDNHFGTMERYNQYRGMDFGDWDKEFNQVDWLSTVVALLKTPSSFVVFNSWQNLKVIADELERLGLSVKRPIVIRKTNPMPVNRNRLFTNSFEFGLWAISGTLWTFNRRGDYETGYFECKNNGVTRHPTEKQVETMYALIMVLSNPNDLILDPFCGSGTTCVAAKMLGRRYIGIDISPEYCKIAQERLLAVDTGVPVKEARKGQKALFGE